MRTIAIAWALLLASGCNPAVHSFHVQPETYCPSTQRIHITWDTSGDTTVTLLPSGKTFHDDEGDVREPAAPMRVTIEAYRHHRKAGAPDRNVAPMPASRPLVDEAGADCDATRTKTRIIPVGPDEYDPRSLVASIKNECASTDPADPCPTITVCHGPDDKHVSAACWDVAAGTPVPLTGVHMAGAWQLARPLQQTESCGPAANSNAHTPTTTGPPPSRHMTHLKVQLGLVCT